MEKDEQQERREGKMAKKKMAYTRSTHREQTQEADSQQGREFP
jgi:hypothetical protein